MKPGSDEWYKTYGEEKKAETKSEKPKRSRTGLMYLTENEVTTFMAAVTEPRDKVIFTLMLRQGLRVGEVVGEVLDYWTKNGHRIKNAERPPDHEKYPANKDIKIGEDVFVHVQNELEGIHLEDVDWQEKQLVVRGKGNKNRFMPLRDEVVQLLNDFVRPTEFDPKDRVGPMFNINPPAVRYQCTKYAKAAGIGRRVHPHIFRHTFAVNYLKMGGNIVALQRLLGHTDLSMTAKYLQLIPDDIRKDLEGVSIQEALTKNPQQAKKELADKIANALTGG